ncbi:hypothetical protein HOD29_02780 [archaeon]|jgi:hypothetical protein|nr:hypothetical protein [archaeon]
MNRDLALQAKCVNCAYNQNEEKICSKRNFIVDSENLCVDFRHQVGWSLQKCTTKALSSFPQIIYESYQEHPIIYPHIYAVGSFEIERDEITHEDFEQEGVDPEQVINVIKSPNSVNGYKVFYRTQF